MHRIDTYMKHKYMKMEPCMLEKKPQKAMHIYAINYHVYATSKYDNMSIKKES